MENSDDMDPAEEMLLDMYRKLPEQFRQAAMTQIATLYNALNPDHPHRADPSGGRKPPEG